MTSHSNILRRLRPLRGCQPSRAPAAVQTRLLAAAALLSVAALVAPRMGLAASVNQWTTGTPEPVGVLVPAAAPMGTAIVLAGGTDATGAARSDVQVYHIQSNSWTKAAKYPTAITNAAAATVGGVVYVFGGLVAAASVNPTNAVYAYTAASGWVQKASMPTPVQYSAAVAYQQYIYLIGGLTTGGAATGAFQRYDTVNDVWSTALSQPSQRYQVNAGLYTTASASYILVSDGATGSGMVTNQTLAYNIALDQWSNQRSDPYIRTEICGGIVKGRFYQAGLVAVGVTVTDYFNPANNSWKTGLATMPDVVWFPTGISSGGKLYCFGGSQAIFGPAGTTVQIYQP